MTVSVVVGTLGEEPLTEHDGKDIAITLQTLASAERIYRVREGCLENGLGDLFQLL